MNTLCDRIAKSLADNNETWADVVASTLSESELNRQHHWASDLPSLTVWTGRNVYSVFYDADDGSYIASVDRNPPVNAYSVKNVPLEAVQRIRKALKDDTAGNSKCTMTDLDSACDLIDELIKLKY